MSLMNATERFDETTGIVDRPVDDVGVNIAHEIVDWHVAAGQGDRVALRCIDDAGQCRDVTYATLARQSDEVAQLFTTLGVQAGDTVCTVLGAGEDLVLTALGCWKIGAVYCALFSAFGPEPLRTRLSIGRARVIVTTRAQYLRKIEALRGELPDLQQVLIVDADDSDLPDGTRDFHHRPAVAVVAPSAISTRADTPALLHFTSGTTGAPKGAVHVHGAVLFQRCSARQALGLNAGDVYWCTADPGWITGVVYGVIAPLACRATLIVDGAGFNGQRWLDILKGYSVNIWYTAPTAIRLLMRIDATGLEEQNFSSLRCIASVGEPLSADAVSWSERVFGMPVRDTWWQTETGAIMIANAAGRAVTPGSMGRALPGIDAAVVRRLDTGGVERIDGVDETGELALRRGWASMFRAYLDEPDRYRRCFAGDWYLTGDLVRRDAQGDFWFVARADDVIKSAGHLIGPFEVERVLLEHPSIVAAGVIGVPDDLLGERVKAYVTPGPGIEAEDALRRELLAHARRRLGAVVAPREIAFCQALPETRSGKIMRRLLKERERVSERTPYDA